MPDALRKRFDPGGDLLPPAVIAEVAQAHDGSLGQAHAFIDAAADAGADAIKFQTHIARAESTAREPWRVPFSRQDASRFEYWRRMEFSEPQWHDLAAHARERGLAFLSSPFSREAVDLLERVGVDVWKVASGEIDHLPLIEAMLATRKPLLLSTGLAGYDDIDVVVARCRDANVPFAVLQCTTAYPCPPERLGLAVIGELRQRYGAPAGLSDHSGTVFASLAAAALGARFLEVHVTFSRRMFGPDTAASVTFEELAQITAGVRFVHRAMHPADAKSAASPDAADLKRLFGRSVVAARDLEPGTSLGAADLALKKPGGGLPATAEARLIGRTLTRARKMDDLIHPDDVDPVLELP